MNDDVPHIKDGSPCWCNPEVVYFHQPTSKKHYDLDRVTRFEVIDHHEKGEGRVFVAYDIKVEFMYQDDGRTLKVRLLGKE